VPRTLADAGMTPDLPGLIRLLAERDVAFVVVGGIAATMHGSAHMTYDLDVVYRRTPDNIDALVRALAPIEPYLRGAPRGLPFTLDADTVARGLNFTLTTTLGDLDLLGEVAGGGTHEALVGDAEETSIDGHPFRYVSLARLIQMKRAAGRPKDLNMLAELEALADSGEDET
jgi:predicted nucleotidyltransferase